MRHASSSRGIRVDDDMAAGLDVDERDEDNYETFLVVVVVVNVVNVVNVVDVAI